MFRKLIEKGFSKGAQILSGQGKTTGKEVISSVPIAPNITTKKAIEQKVVKTVDKAFKDANVPPSLRNQQKKSLLKRDEGKKLKSISYRLDELEEKVKKRNEGSKKLFEASKGRKFNKGGRVGLKRGTFPDHSGDGQITQKDILMAKGVIPKPKGKKSKSPMDKQVRKA